MTTIQNMGDHRAMRVVEEENAFGEQTGFLKCVECGFRTTLDSAGSFSNVPCESYQRGTK
jgi:hypothetical protein